MSPARHVLASLSLLSTLACSAPPARAQAPEARFQRAYYLEHAEGRVQAALELYRGVAQEHGAPEELRRKARSAAEGLAEELAAQDLAALFPPETIAYAELARPGERLGDLVRALGLLGREGEAPAQLALSPLLLRSALGLRGLALGLTHLDERGEPAGGLLVLHPGEHELAQGLLETVLPAAGSLDAPCGGHPVWKLEQGYAMRTRRLFVLALERADLEGVARRLAGLETSSFVLASPVREALPQAERSLLSFYVRGEPLRPHLARALAQAAASDPDARRLALLLDPESVRSVAGSLALDAAGLELALALELEEAHKSIAFHLLRLPPLGVDCLGRVPAGAAGFLALALNPQGAQGAPGAPAAPRGESAAGPAVSAMDFGRELFANVVDLSLFALPSADGAPDELPPVVASVRVHDVERSRALWRLVLSLASEGPVADPELVTVAGEQAERWQHGGLPLLLLARERELLLSPSRAALERALELRASGRSLSSDASFAAALRELGPDSSLALVIHAGRALALLRPHGDESEARRAHELARALEATTLALGLAQSPTRLALDARLRGLPDLSGLVRSALGTPRALARAAEPATEEALAGSAEQGSDFRR